MEEYPKDLMELEQAFASEEQCRAYLFGMKWPDGFVCPYCRKEGGWNTKELKIRCKHCRKTTSILAGTLFQDTHKPLVLWFRAIWHITSQKNGASALGLQRVLGLGSYHTAWVWLHKLRRAMVSPERNKLSGIIEIDETYIGSPEHDGKRGRGAGNKVLTVIAVELIDNHMGRVRMSIIESASSEHLHAFIEKAIEHGSTLVTDGWNGYNGIESKGYVRIIQQVKQSDEDTTSLPHAHIIISLLKRWLLGTLQGAWEKEYLAYYLDEYTFRFNRRNSKTRGHLFYRLLENAVLLDPVPLKAIRNHA
jgi:transposase-like protein